MRKTLPKWSSHSLWLAQCSRRLWLARPPKSLSPPMTINECLSESIHHLIAQVFRDERDFCLTVLQEEFCHQLDKIKQLGFDIEDRLVMLGKRSLANFYRQYAIGSDLSDVIASEVKVAIRMSQKGNPISDWGSKGIPYYELFGRVDEIHRCGTELIIRDFKLSDSHKNDDKMFRQKLQLGIYRICLKPQLEKYNCTEILCEIFDLSTGVIILVEPFSTGKIHSIVKKTERRILARDKGRNKDLCPSCPYKPICNTPYNPPLEWKRTKEDLSTQLLLFDIP